MEPHLNFAAIAVAALVPMIVGFVYYHQAVLGGPWMKANGFTLDGMTAPKPILYVVALGFSFLLSMFMCLNTTVGVEQQFAPDGHSYATFGHGAVHGILMSLFVILPLLGTMSIFEKRSWSWVFVNWGYWLVTLVVMGGILSAWR